MVGKLLRALVIILVVMLIGVKFLPFGTRKFESETTGKTFAVPSLATPSGECCMYAATFKTLRGVWSLGKDVERILARDYEEKVCANGAKVYYDETQDVTVRSYSVRLGFPMNEVVISYDLGKSC